MKDKDPLATSGLPPLNRQKQDEHARREDARKYLILVVDDLADNVAVISLNLQERGYRVVTATNGEEAISVATQTSPNLILMDISMPTLDGLGATRRIRENEALRDIPVIAVTAFGTEGFQRAAYDVGVSGYLTKPIDFERMHQLIARLLSPTGSGNLGGSVS
ncbi:MAG TPA: response regulator [Pyrinomonadaceae bacterium]|jgi:CheY-like chemotaxis protein